MQRLKPQVLRKKLYTKNRLVIVNENTFEEIFSLRLTLMNVFVVATLGAILIVTATTFIIAFSPLREFIPGYSSGNLKRNATEMALKSDSLALALKKNEAYIESIKKVLLGKMEHAELSEDSIKSTKTQDDSKINLDASEAEREFRKEKPRSKI